MSIARSVSFKLVRNVFIMSRFSTKRYVLCIRFVCIKIFFLLKKLVQIIIKFLSEYIYDCDDIYMID